MLRLLAAAVLGIVLMLAPEPWPLSIPIVMATIGGAVVGLGFAVGVILLVLQRSRGVERYAAGLIALILLAQHGLPATVAGAAAGYLTAAHLHAGNGGYAAASAAVGGALLASIGVAIRNEIRLKTQRSTPVAPASHPSDGGAGAKSR